MHELDSKYNLSNEDLNLQNVSLIIENNFNEQTLTDIFPKYQIINQNISDFPLNLPYDITNSSATEYSTIPEAKSDMINLSLDDFQVFSYHSAYLYNKNLTIEYELTEEAEFYLDEIYGFGINSVDDLTKKLGTYRNLAQIYAVVKLDGKKIANGNSNLLGSKEMMKLHVRSASGTADFEKELIYGGLYSIVFDYQIISPHDTAARYSKLPQNTTAQSKINQNNVFGSSWLMDTLTLLGKSYFSQLDTNNEISSEFSNIHYERSISIAVIDFTPNIYSQNGETTLTKEGSFGIDVIGNQTIFTSRENNKEDESKIRHSSGFLSSLYESEVITQFTGFQAVSTAEVLNFSAEQDIDILYLSSANISDLNTSNLSDQNKEDVNKLINEGNYVTLPNDEIQIRNWSGTGYIVYNPTTDLSSFVINTNLNGGQLCSWVSLALLADALASVVECVWAFDLIMLGATILGAGLILLSGPIGIALAGIVIGTGIIIGGTFYLKNIGDRLYESTDLMNAYLNGDAAGEQLKTKAALHFGVVAVGHFGGKLLSKPISSLANKIHLEEKFGRVISNPFANTLGGYTKAISILNRISPKYTEMITGLVEKYGTQSANSIIEIDNQKGTEGIKNVLDNFENNKLYQEIVKEADNFTDYLNLAGNKVRIPKQAVNTIPNSINSNLSSADIGKATEAKVANYINTQTNSTVVQYANKVNKVGANQIGDIDVATDKVLIEVKSSISSVEVKQFYKYANPFGNNFLNFENKQVVLYVDKPIDMSNPNVVKNVRTLQDMGVTIVNGLEELLEVLK